MAQGTSVLLFAVLFVSLGGTVMATPLPSADEVGLAEKVMNVVTAHDFLSLEEIKTPEEQKDFQPRLRELLVNSSLPKNHAKIVFMELKRTPWYSKVWAKLFLEVRDQSTYTYDLTFPDGQRHLARFIVKKDKGDKVGFELLGKFVNDDVVTNSEFNLREKSVFQYFFLFVVFLVPVFIIYTAIQCVRFKLENWLPWVVFILFGFIQYDMNWATGRMGLRPISLIFLGSQLQHTADFSPWILSTSVPFGAVLFYWKRRKAFQNLSTCVKV